MNLHTNIENKSQNVNGGVSKADVIAAIRRAAEGKFYSISEAALVIKDRICAVRPVLADEEDFESVMNVLVGSENPTAEETAAREFFLACSNEERAIIRLLLHVALRDENLANEMRASRIRGEQHPEAVVPALKAAITGVRAILSLRVVA